MYMSCTHVPKNKERNKSVAEPITVDFVQVTVPVLPRVGGHNELNLVTVIKEKF
jgi:hypothetical protein